MATIVFFHAHPDDEAIATAGTMAALADQGHRGVLVTATQGELGETPDGLLAPGETLAQRRQIELDEACRILGVAHHEYLDYLDSGMAGEDTNLRPGSFAGADVGEAAAQDRRRRPGGLTVAHRDVGFERHTGEDGPVGQSGQQPGRHLVGGGRVNDRAGDHGGHERPWRQRSPQLLDDHDQFGQAEARAAVLLG